jgi:hypothetical protein
MDDLVEVVVPVVDVHRVVMVEVVVVQALDYQFVLLMANVVVVDDEEDGHVDAEDDDDVVDNAKELVDNYYYYYCCFPYVHYYYHNYLNDVVDNVYSNVVLTIDVDFDHVAYVKTRKTRMMMFENGNEYVSENGCESVNEIWNEYENVTVNGNESESENEIMND